MKAARQIERTLNVHSTESVFARVEYRYTNLATAGFVSANTNSAETANRVPINDLRAGIRIQDLGQPKLPLGDNGRRDAAPVPAFRTRCMLQRAAELKAAYGRDTMPRGFLGLLTQHYATNTCISSPTDAARSLGSNRSSPPRAIRSLGCRKRWT